MPTTLSNNKGLSLLYSVQLVLDGGQLSVLDPAKYDAGWKGAAGQDLGVCGSRSQLEGAGEDKGWMSSKQGNQGLGQGGKESGVQERQVQEEQPQHQHQCVPSGVPLGTHIHSHRSLPTSNTARRQEYHREDESLSQVGKWVDIRHLDTLCAQRSIG
jgi:hypothetical protein